MSDVQTLRDLIARVEAATGPDRDIARDIALAIGWERKDFGDGWEWREPGGSWHHTHSEVPDFTSSLDAAVSLASDWVIASLGDMVADGLPGAVLLLSTDPLKHVTGIGYGTRESGCLARALCAAALRARQAEMEASDDR